MIHIATVATHSERYLPVLEKMVLNNKISFHKLGFGKKYTGHFMKDLEMINFLKDKNPYDIVIFLDGFDSLMIGKKDEIINKFKETKKQMIISIENVRNSFLTHSYNFQKVQEKFINTGLYMGYCGFVLNFLEKMYEKGYNKKSNQTTWSGFLNSKQDNIDFSEIGLDKNSSIFLNHSFTCNNEFYFDKKNKRLILNKDQEPCFIQGNGVVNMNDLIKNLGYDKHNVFKSKIMLEGFKYTYNAVMKTYPILKIFIFSIIMILVIAVIFIYFNYKFRKFETINLVFS